MKKKRVYPCMGCEKRHEHCHDDCGRFLSEKIFDDGSREQSDVVSEYQVLKRIRLNKMSGKGKKG